MAGLCEGGDEPAVSLKAICKIATTYNNKAEVVGASSVNFSRKLHQFSLAKQLNAAVTTFNGSLYRDIILFLLQFLLYLSFGMYFTPTPSTSKLPTVHDTEPRARKQY
ncbi:hypothetical protein ANN_00032 [Periplaneta americana]|uniref:Uncharacterized protein n=1 Tax=Periplaneta americana TaxID=6978 RepID=A0ABQ8TRG9_PERAM|nr:hypothetical protein ANN_00032 [Periplaneta americana]